MKKKPLIIFDCDGVLVDSEPVTNQIISKNLNRYGLSLSPQECINLFVGGTMIGVGVKAKEMGASIPDNWIDEIYEEIYARLRQGVEPINGIAQVIQKLKSNGIEFCVASNGSDEKMQITLGGIGLFNQFEGNIFSAHTVGIAKPNPGLFLHAAKKMGYEAEHCIVIEDSASGVKAAIAAGMKCFGLDEHGDGQKLKSLGAIPFYKMADLPKLLNY